MAKVHLRGCLATFAALALLWAQTARADVADGGADPDAAVSDAAGGGEVGGPPPGELATPPELAPPTTSGSLATTPFVETPAPAPAEPPRPITKRLWFWLAVTGVIVGAVAIGIAVHSPSVSRPDCPAGYVCPL